VHVFHDPTISEFIAKLFESIAAGGLPYHHHDSNQYYGNDQRQQQTLSSFLQPHAKKRKWQQQQQDEEDQHLFLQNHQTHWPNPGLTRFDLFHAHLFIPPLPSSHASNNTDLEEDWLAWEVWLNQTAAAEDECRKVQGGMQSGADSSAGVDCSNSSSSSGGPPAGNDSFSSGYPRGSGTHSARDTWPSPDTYNSTLAGDTRVTSASGGSSWARRRSSSRGSSWVGPSVGLLFHAAEYPAYHEEDFPIYLGYCQEGSDFKYDQRRMDVRNIIWYQVRYWQKEL
jgi:hypothetical protein